MSFTLDAHQQHGQMISGSFNWNGATVDGAVGTGFTAAYNSATGEAKITLDSSYFPAQQITAVAQFLTATGVDQDFVCTIKSVTLTTGVIIFSLYNVSATALANPSAAASVHFHVFVKKV